VEERKGQKTGEKIKGKRWREKEKMRRKNKRKI
jgi:hypothetical protein